MSNQYKLITNDIVTVNVTTNEEPPQCILDKRFNKSITVADLKGKLELYTGGQAATMTVKFYNKDNEYICTLDDDNALLGSYHVDDGGRLNVEDQFLLKKQCLEDPNIERCEMSKEEYEKRSDTLKAYLQKNKIGKYNEEEMRKKALERFKEEEAESMIGCHMTVDRRCLIKVLGQPERRGTIKFVGNVHFKSGFWIGVQYDEPMGKNDGSVQGRRYFECPPKYGGFVKPSSIVLGDFPEEDLGLNDEL